MPSWPTECLKRCPGRARPSCGPSTWRDGFTPVPPCIYWSIASAALSLKWPRQRPLPSAAWAQPGVTVIEDRCNLASTTASFRLHAAKAFGCFRVPSVEAALLRLLASEDDRAATTAICQALVDTCTTLSVDRIGEALKAGRCNRTPELDGGLAALKVMLKEKPARLPESGTTKPKPASGALAAFSPFSLGNDPIPADDEPLQASAAKPAPIRRSVAKAGRNDPCPCGSGKKYKKCCGK